MKPHYEKYVIDINEYFRMYFSLLCSCGTMILDALFKIKNEQDPTFVFRR